MQNVLKAVVPLIWAVLPSLAHGLTLNLPATVVAEESRSETPGSYALPLGPFDGQSVPSRSVEGALDQRVFELDAPDMTTLAVLEPLRAQITAAGYKVLLDCHTEGCGGFDFRFGTDVMPEPDMHVDLGDFRFLSAEKGDEAISVLVSRSATASYVQITRVTPVAMAAAPAGTTVDLEVEVPRGLPAPITGDIGATLDAAGSVVLEDLVFASGSSALAEGEYGSLAGLVAWLEANPDGTLALVGHTDASGTLAANIALSERRARAVAQVLVNTYGADARRISSEGVGFLAPRASNQTDEGRQKNRRVEAVVTSTR